MAAAIIKVLIGLFIWFVLPQLIYNKRKYKKNTTQFFVNVACKIIGITLIVFAIIGLLQVLLVL